MTKKIIAVVGATGSQGGGLTRAILESGGSEYQLRALTRNPESDKAQSLASAGADVVQADLDDVASVARAFEGAYGAFCLTNFWEHFSPEKELAQAENMARAADQAGLRHVIWSTLEDTRKWVPLEDDRMPTLMDRFKVPHFDAKGEADGFFEEAGVPTTYLLTTFYWDNFIHFGMGPKKGADGKVTLSLPMADKKLAGIAAEDIGHCAFGIFRAGDKYLNQRVGICGDQLTGKQMAAALGSALGQEVVYQAVPHDTYRGLGFPGAEDLGNMFQFYCDFEDHFGNSRDPDLARTLSPDLLSFEAWLELYAGRIPLED